MSDEFETVDVKVHITAGDDFKTIMEFPTVKGSERVYWSGASFGAATGLALASDLLVELIPDGLGMQGDVLRAAGVASKKARGE